MSDYGKPVGWWCTSCGREYTASTWHDREGFRHYVYSVAGDGCDGGACIPVFAEIPAGQRPETEWDCPEVHLAEMEGEGEPLGWFYASDEHLRADRVEVGVDAVLWAVEGQRP